jgi:hypothetical protein
MKHFPKQQTQNTLQKIKHHFLEKFPRKIFKENTLIFPVVEAYLLYIYTPQQDRGCGCTWPPPTVTLSFLFLFGVP